MIAARVAAAILGIACAIVPGDALAQEPPVVCDGAEPAPISLRESGIDAPRSACTGDEIAGFARGIATIDTDNFYGTLAGSFLVRGRWLTRAGIELEAAARVLDYRFVQNAVLTDDELGAGPVSVGIASSEPVQWLGLDGQWTALLRVEIPRSQLGLSLTALLASPAVVWTARIDERWRLHSRLAMLLWSARTSRTLDSRLAVMVGSDATARLASWLDVSLGVEAQGGWYRGPLDHLLGRAALSAGGRTRVSLGLGVPVVGDERANASVLLGISRAL